MSIPCSYRTLLHLSRRDRARKQKRERAILETQKRRRRQLSARTITAQSSRKRRSKTPSASQYKSGKYGTELLEPEDNSGYESDKTCEICGNAFALLVANAELMIGSAVRYIRAGFTVDVQESIIKT